MATHTPQSEHIAQHDGINNSSDNDNDSNDSNNNDGNDGNNNNDEMGYIFYTVLSHWQVLYISLVCLLLIFWLKHASITHYLQQSYQISPFWQSWQQSAILKMGKQLNTAFNQSMIFTNHHPANPLATLANNTGNDPQYQQHQQFSLETAIAALPNDDEIINNALKNGLNDNTKHTQTLTKPTSTPPITPVQISKASKVFFVGDSLMEGVAPKAMRLLRKKYGINSINLSKQNTGLSYNTFFNWTEMVENTFATHDNIRLMVVFMGANDPWDVPNPKKPWQYIRFGTKAWDTLYKQKVTKLLVSADSRGASVIWLLMPAMKKKKLNQHISHLNSLYVQAITEFNQQKHRENTATYSHDDASTKQNQFIVWATQPLLSTKHSEELIHSNPQQIMHALTNADTLQASSKTMLFSATAQVDKNLVKVRTGDGIHFTPKGQQTLADALLAFIAVDD